LIDQH